MDIIVVTRNKNISLRTVQHECCYRTLSLLEMEKYDTFQSLLCLICKLSWTSRPIRQANCSKCPDDRLGDRWSDDCDHV